MPLQSTLDFTAARETGRVAGEACLASAERASFNTSAAASYIVDCLRRNGPTPGEVLTDAAIAQGFKPPKAQAFGPIYAKLLRDGVIRVVGECKRTKGNGSRGGSVYAAVSGGACA